MNRDYGKEIDGIHAQLNEMKDMLRALTPPPQAPADADTPPPNLSDLQRELCAKMESDGTSGYVSYAGVFEQSGRQSNWISHIISTDKLLALIESNAASQVLSCIGNNDRLNLLLALLRAPRTAAQLVATCGYNTTGQVYHHLKPLLAADLLKEDEHSRGVYLVQPHRVQGIIMLLAGISDMLDTRYTQGAWEVAAP